MVQLLTEYLRKKRMSIIKKYLKGDILDVGCGPANIINVLDKNQKYVGIERDENIVSELRKEYVGSRFYSKNLESDSFDDILEKFDTVLFIAVIEHLSNPQNVLNEIAVHTKEEGKIVITTLTPFANRIHKIGAAMGLFSKLAVEEHKRTYNYTSMKKLLEPNNLKIVDYQKFEFGLNQLFIVKSR